MKKLREIDVFTLDLGQSRIPVGEDRVRITDRFIKQYRTSNQSDVQMFGHIGSIRFYTDPNHRMDGFTV